MVILNSVTVGIEITHCTCLVDVSYLHSNEILERMSTRMNPFPSLLMGRGCNCLGVGAFSLVTQHPCLLSVSMVPFTVGPIF